MEPNANEPARAGLNRVLTPVSETFGLNRVTALTSVLLVVGVVGFAVFWFFYSAPPRTLTITAGPEGSTFRTNAMRYREILAREKVTLKILPSKGSQENLDRLNDPKFQVDIGFVQGGVSNALGASKLVSLGSISHQPLLIFYRSATPLPLLSDLRGRRLAIGPEGSGTRALALTLLGLNGITETNATTSLLDLDAEAAAKALLGGSVDAVFLMGDSASVQIMVELVRAPGIQLMDFTQADGYTRKISYLDKLELPMGSIDFGKNIPARDLYLIGPTVEILARPNLHPALSDLLLEAAREVNGTPNLLRRKGEFPAPLEHDFPISADAMRFYKSGKTFLYRSLPFWLASLMNRILVAIVPLIVVLIPGVRAIPALYKWRMRLLIYRRYRALLSLERDILDQIPPKKREELLVRLHSIETTVNGMKVPASFADQFYSLRTHIDFVRNRLTTNTGQ